MFLFISAEVTIHDIECPNNTKVTLKEGSDYVFTATAEDCSNPPMTITWIPENLPNTGIYNNGSSCATLPSYGKAESTFEIKNAQPVQSGYLILIYNHTSYPSAQRVIYAIEITKGELYFISNIYLANFGNNKWTSLHKGQKLNNPLCIWIYHNLFFCFYHNLPIL